MRSITYLKSGSRVLPTLMTSKAERRREAVSLILIILAALCSSSSLARAFAPRTRPPFAPETTSKMPEERMLTPVKPADVSLEIKDPVDELALGQAKEIITELRPNTNGPVDAQKLLDVAKRLGDVTADHTGSYTISAEECKAAFDGLTDTERNALVNIHRRVKVFAEAQRNSVADIEIDIPGGKAGHTVSPCRGMFLFLFLPCTDIYLPPSRL